LSTSKKKKPKNKSPQSKNIWECPTFGICGK